jgi:hypothetical protein
VSVNHLVKNARFIEARESIESLVFPGQSPTRGELATRVRAELRRRGSDYEFTTRHVSRLERGETRWPMDEDVRGALRSVLGAATDEDLGFSNSRRRESAEMPAFPHESDMPESTRQPHRLDGSCAHVTAVRELLPENFFDQALIKSALDRRDFGVVFRAVRRHAGLNQVELASLLCFTQGRVSKIESGKRGLHELDDVVHVANVFGLDPRGLGFAMPASCDTCRIPSPART